MDEKPLPVRMETSGLTPIHAQLFGQIRQLILSGTLAPDEQLPSVRALAKQVLVNPNTVARVYRDLLQAGLVQTRRGDGCYVNPAAAKAAPADRAQELRPHARRLAEEAQRLDVAKTKLLELLSHEWDEAKKGDAHG